MKNIFKYLQVILLFVILQAATAQKDVTGFLYYGLDNARVLSEEYLMPQSNMISATLNGGWFSTAKIHHLGGVDIKAGINYVFVPSGDYLFNVEDMISSGALDNISLAGSSVIKAPTVSKRFLQGQDRPVLDYNGAETEMPNGSDYNSMMSPLIGLNVGIGINTEISFRYMLPFGDSNGGDASMYGIALKHSLKNYLPFLRRTPFLQLSLAGNYSNYKSTVDVSYDSGTDQQLSIDASGYGGTLLIGMDFPVFGFLGNIGYSISDSNFDLKGSFTGTPDGTLDSPALVEYSDGYMNFGAGMFFRLYQFRIIANYSYCKYSMINAQLAFEFGN